MPDRQDTVIQAPVGRVDALPAAPAERGPTGPSDLAMLASLGQGTTPPEPAPRHQEQRPPEQTPAQGLAALPPTQGPPPAQGLPPARATGTPSSLDDDPLGAGSWTPRPPRPVTPSRDVSSDPPSDRTRSPRTRWAAPGRWTRWLPRGRTARGGGQAGGPLGGGSHGGSLGGDPLGGGPLGSGLDNGARSSYDSGAMNRSDYPPLGATGSGGGGTLPASSDPLDPGFRPHSSGGDDLSSPIWSSMDTGAHQRPDLSSLGGFGGGHGGPSGSHAAPGPGAQPAPGQPMGGPTVPGHQFPGSSDPLTGGYATGAFTSGASYDGGSYDSGAFSRSEYDTGTHQRSPYDTGAHTRDYTTGTPHHGGPSGTEYDTGTHHRPAYDTDSFTRSEYDTGTHQRSPYDTGAHTRDYTTGTPHHGGPSGTEYDTGTHHRPAYDTDSFTRSEYDTGTHQRSPYDTGAHTRDYTSSTPHHGGPGGQNGPGRNLPGGPGGNAPLWGGQDDTGGFGQASQPTVPGGQPGQPSPFGQGPAVPPGPGSPVGGPGVPGYPGAGYATGAYSADQLRGELPTTFPGHTQQSDPYGQQPHPGGQGGFGGPGEHADPLRGGYVPQRPEPDYGYPPWRAGSRRTRRLGTAREGPASSRARGPTGRRPTVAPPLASTTRAATRTAVSARSRTSARAARHHHHFTSPRWRGTPATSVFLCPGLSVRTCEVWKKVTGSTTARNTESS
ncbi:hypothetical protein KGD82_10370 [Nocardiopsis eucommiae]|uniref:Uncharacterized protein n=1 Tax=Nocardiopsis eucommiae TaxID=2831970 RepID=A0A975LCL0_9ACTN|nr:hypothetical protein KGD82_10370 [Nocardiopsis eucommiae]